MNNNFVPFGKWALEASKERTDFGNFSKKKMYIVKYSDGHTDKVYETKENIYTEAEKLKNYRNKYYGKEIDIVNIE